MTGMKKSGACAALRMSCLAAMLWAVSACNSSDATDGGFDFDGSNEAALIDANSGTVDAKSDAAKDASSDGTLDGCANTMSDPANCGSCDHACPTGELCSSGTCAVTCGQGLSTCMVDGGAIRCVSTQSDNANCGACGQVCGAGQVCSGGSCRTTCQPTETQCTPAGGTAYCANKSTDNANCGACGTACSAGQVCSNGTCGLTCQAGLLNCSGTCTDPSASRAFCGATGTCQGASAGTACAAGQVCSAGQCTVSCLGGQVNCGAACVDPRTTNQFCGASGTCLGASAGTICATGQVCSAGACGLTCQSGLVNCGGTCIDPRTSRAFCGASGACQAANGGTACAAGQVCSGGACGLTCQAGLVDCNGTCVDPMTTRSNCGATGACVGASGGMVCASGQVCTGGVCSVSCPIPQVNCGGTCVNRLTDPNHCGAIGDCSSSGANSTGIVCSGGATCQAGTCGCPIGDTLSLGLCCPTGESNCGGVCINEANDPLHCGSCSGPNHACIGGTVCGGGVCAVSCPGSQVNCSSSCVDPATDPVHCGAKGDCATTNVSNDPGTACAGGTTCQAGVCACPSGETLSTGLCCPSGQTNCGGVCINTANDPVHCGSCSGVNHVCSGGTVCGGGACGVACPGTQVDCGGSCVAPATDPVHCGAKGDCVTMNISNDPGTACAGGTTCQAGVCACPSGETLSTGLCCPSGQTNCGGVCINTANDPTHCGSCSGANHLCSGGTICGGGVCTVSCPGTQVNCGSSCVDSATDPVHCGAKGDCATINVSNDPGTACTGGATCQTGICACPSGQSLSAGLCCPSGQTNCSGVCVNLANDPNNCGGCGGGFACPSRAHAATVCASSSCGFVCSAGFKDCDGDPTNGCESTSASDTGNCGTCGNACSGATNGSPVCTGGSCQPFACNAGFLDCDFNPGNGCECAPQHVAAPSCDFFMMSCDYTTCTPPFLDCNANRTDGCETNGSTDPTHCGACGTPCAAPPAHSASTCAGGTCGSACLAGFSDCNANLTDGCETAITTNTDCGACGIACMGATACCGSTCLPTSAPPAVCTPGNDAGALWVVCAADGTNALISSTDGNGGNYHAAAICQSLGYCRADQYWGTSGHQCGDNVGASCSANGSRLSFLGDPGNGTIGITVMWECVH